MEGKYMNKQEESDVKGQKPDVKADEDYFVCPLCDAEHAVPGVAGEEMLCPKCVVPLKPKQKKN